MKTVYILNWELSCEEEVFASKDEALLAVINAEMEWRAMNMTRVCLEEEVGYLAFNVQDLMNTGHIEDLALIYEADFHE